MALWDQAVYDDPLSTWDGIGEAEEALSFVGATARWLYEALGRALTKGDEELGYPLLWFCYCATVGLARVNSYVRDSDAGPGWSVLFDIDRVPASQLGYLGQFVGVEPTPGFSTADQREEIRTVKGFRRGTVGAIQEAGRPTLTGERRVILHERDSSPYHLTVQTYAFETPEPARTLQALLAAKPASLQLSYLTTLAATYGQAEDAFPTYGDAEAAFATYNDAETWIP